MIHFIIFNETPDYCYQNKVYGLKRSKKFQTIVGEKQEKSEDIPRNVETRNRKINMLLVQGFWIIEFST